MIALPLAAQEPEPAVPFLQPGTAGRSIGLQINPEAVTALRQTTGTVRLSGVPLVTGQAADFTLQPARLLSNEAQFILVEDSDTTRAVALPDVRAWLGSDPSLPNTSVYISANQRNELRVMVIGDANTSVTVISQDDTSPDNSYKISANNLPDIPLCGGINPPLGPGDLLINSVEPSRSPRSTTMFDFDLTLDVAHDLYRRLGADPEFIAEYLLDLMYPVTLIYRRDLQVNLVINNVYVWASPDPFTAADRDNNPAISTQDQLYNYRDYVAATRAGNWDVTHLLDAKPGLGGLAYLNVLQQPQAHIRSGVSNVIASGDFPADINTYYWDVMVVGHELGHNFGSPHTHCYNPPLDCCAVQSGCTGCTGAAPAAGSIMSYCHLQLGNGGSMVMAFHVESIALMRPLIENSPFRSVHTTTADLRVEGVGGLTVGAALPHRGNTLRSGITGGPVVNQTFTIRSTGDVPLQLTGTTRVSITGSPLLTIASQPPVSTLNPGESTSFVVQYNPQTSAQVSAIITIPTNRVGNPIFSFPVKGMMVAQSAPVTASFNGAYTLDPGYWHDIDIIVTDVPGWVSDVDVRFNGTNCSIPSQTGLEHPWVGDLRIRLVSPDGTEVNLVESPGAGPNGSDGENFCNLLLDDAASASIDSISGTGPFSGSYRPMAPLSAFNGQRPNGTWTLRVADPYTQDTGVLRSVSLIVRGEVATNVADWNLY